MVKIEGQLWKSESVGVRVGGFEAVEKRGWRVGR